MSALLLLLRPPSAFTILDVLNWEKVGANLANYEIDNDIDGNLIITSAGGTPNFITVALKTSVQPVLTDAAISCTIRCDTWDTLGVGDQKKCGIAARIEAGPDAALLVLSRHSSNAFQIRGRDMDDGADVHVNTTQFVGASETVAGLDYDMTMNIIGLSMAGSIKRTDFADTPTMFSGTLIRNTGDGQVGIGCGALLAGSTVTVSAFDVNPAGASLNETSPAVLIGDF